MRRGWSPARHLYYDALVRRLLPLLVAATFAACSTGGGCAGCIQPLPNGYQGPRFDSAASARLTQTGFDTVNTTIGPALLQQFAPGNQLVVPMPCSIQNVAIGGFPIADLTIADEGQLYCTSETCGQLDGKCDAQDVPKVVTLNINSFSLAPDAPDRISAQLDLTVATGKIMISSVSRNSPLCLFSDPVKCSVDLDTSRASPSDLQLDLHIQFTADTRWDRVLTFNVPDIGGSTPCGTAGAQPPPKCLDPADVLIASEGACGICSVSNFSVVKQVILSQITSSLKTQIEDALRQANCRPCGPMGECPASGVATSSCQVPDGGVADAGQCIDDGTGACVPALIGVEGRIPLGTFGSFFPPQSAMDLSLVAGGSASADTAGFTQGVLGGFQEVEVSPCVKAQAAPPTLNIPLAPLDADAPGAYDVGLGLSQQAIEQALFHAQQSGALCIEIGHESVSYLDSSLLATVMPSLATVTEPPGVPLRIALRPTQAPTATVGLNTIDPMTGTLIDPLVTVTWPQVEVDVYGLLEQRYARLFTVAADVKLPVGLSISGCSDVTPVLGDLTNAITNVHGKNSEILAEPLTSIEMLVPSLISLAEPALANGFPSFTVPQVNGWQLKLLEARGVGLIPGTSNYQHVGLYANLIANGICPTVGPRAFSRFLRRTRDTAVLEVGSESPYAEYAYRVAGGFWSTWRPAPGGVLEVHHPRLMLGGPVPLEVRSRDVREPRAIGTVAATLVPPLQP